MPLKPCANTTIAGRANPVLYATITKYTPRVYIGTARVDARRIETRGIEILFNFPILFYFLFHFGRVYR